MSKYQKLQQSRSKGENKGLQHGVHTRVTGAGK